MAESELLAFIENLKQVLDARKDWFERTEIDKLKESLHTFYSSYASLYNIFLKKKQIDEDPYKQETKISELEVPDSSAFQDMKRIEQLSIRLSNFDSQVDFLVNFYQLGIDFLNLDRIKRIVGLLRYIEWNSLTPDSQSVMTKAVSELSMQAKQGVDTLTLSIIGESLSRLSKMTVVAMGVLKDLNIYYRECYKLKVRQNVTQSISANEATLDNFRKKITATMPGSPFYKELIEEIIKEDYSKTGMDLRDALLNSLRVVEEKPKAVKAPVNFKNILLDGIHVIGGASTPIHEMVVKLHENQTVLDNHKKGFIETIKELIRQITNAEPEEVIHNVEYLDPTKGVTVKERVSFHKFCEELDKKNKILTSFMRGPAFNKLSAMTEDQIIGYLDRNIREVQNYHRTLNALDDFYKANAGQEERDKIKGIKPELSALKNIIVKANQFRYEYSAQKEQEEQMKRLGLNPGAVGAAGAPPAEAPASSKDEK